MGKADLHIHSSYSWDGTATVSAILERTANYTNLDVIAITDHDAVQGALEAQQLGPKFGVDVIPGCEISTAEGHLLALFIHTQIPAGRPLVETVLRVAEQGGLCVAAHPTARGVHSLSFESVRRALQVPEVRPVLVGAEALNSGLVDRHSNSTAQALAEEFDLAATGSTDSHVIWTIGHAATEFPGRTSQDLRTALVERTTWPVFQTDWHSLPYYLSFISRRLLRQLGWVTWTPEPNSPFVLQRLARVQA